MASAPQRLATLRERYGLLDHLVRMQQHYGAVKASQQAGAVTYFAFLSFFPVLALAFFVVGYVSEIYPAANQNLIDAINSVLPDLVGPGDDQIALDDVRTFSGLAGLIGLAGVLYAGLGWVSALREGLLVVFDTPLGQQPSFVKGKLRDLLVLVVVGLVLLVSVAVAGFVAAFSSTLLDLIGLGSELAWLVRVLAVVLGLVANALLFFALFRLLAAPEAPRRSLVSGAVLGALGFEALKQVSGLLLASTKSQPAFQAFGIALILVVWINYFSRLVMYAAAWAHTTPEARALRDAQPAAVPHGPATPDLSGYRREDGVPSASPPARRWATAFAAGSAATLAVIGYLRRRQ